MASISVGNIRESRVCSMLGRMFPLPFRAVFASVAFFVIVWGIVISWDAFGSWRIYSDMKARCTMWLSKAILDGDGSEAAVAQRDLAFLKSMPFSVRMGLVRCDREYSFFSFSYLPESLRHDPRKLAEIVAQYGQQLRSGSYMACSMESKGFFYNVDERFIVQKISLPSGRALYGKKFFLGREMSDFVWNRYEGH